MKTLLAALATKVSVCAILSGTMSSLSAQTIPFVAKLANKNGVLVEGSPIITYRLYSHPTAGDMVWSETSSNAVTKGIVSLNLGSTVSLENVFLDEDLWLGISVGSDSEMSPRVKVPKQNPSVRPGTIAPFAGPASEDGSAKDYSNVPLGWLLCDGAYYSKTDPKYRRLFKAIKVAWGTDPTNTDNFRVPDLRGLFLRGVNDSPAGISQNDPDASTRTAINSGGNAGNQVGSYQTDQLKQHNHHLAMRVGGDDGNFSFTDAFASGDTVNLTEINTSSDGGNETRGKNAYVNYIIKY